MKRKIYVTVWERADKPDKNLVYNYKKGKRLLRETSGGEYYVLLNGERAYVGFYKNSLDVYIKYYSDK